MCDMNEGRSLHGLVKVNSIIYVFGGEERDTAEEYDLDYDTWNMIDNTLP